MNIIRVLFTKLKKAAVNSDGRNGVGVQQLWGTVRVD
jgi:hypothetical protein